MSAQSIGKAILFLAALIVLSSCGGGGSAVDNGVATLPPSAPISPISPSAPELTGISPASGAIVLGSSESVQISSVVNSAEGQTRLTAVAGSQMANELQPGSPLLIPAGASSILPFGVAAIATSRIVNTDGTVTAEIRAAELADVIENISIGGAPTAIGSSSFIGLIAPRAFAPTADRSSAQSLNFDLSVRGGAIRFFDRNGKSRALSAKQTQGGLFENTIDISGEYELAKAVDDPTSLKSYGSGKQAKAVIKGTIKNLTFRHAVVFEKSSGLKSFNIGITADIDVDAHIEGGFSAELGAFNKAWKEVEEEHINVLGVASKFTGLDSKDKIGRIPIAGLVFSIPTGSGYVFRSNALTQTSLRFAKAGGFILWVYVNAHGKIEIDGKIGARINGGHLNLGLEKPDLGDIAVKADLGPIANSRLIEAPYAELEGKVSARAGGALDVDLFILGVRFGSAYAEYGFAGQLEVNGTYSSIFTSSGDWLQEGRGCSKLTIGKGLIIGGRLGLGIDIDAPGTGWDKSLKFAISKQVPAEDEIYKVGPHGYAWETLAGGTWCFPTPVVTGVAVAIVDNIAIATLVGENLPNDIKIDPTLNKFCDDSGLVSTRLPYSATLQCRISGQRDFTFNFVSDSASNLVNNVSRDALLVRAGSVRANTAFSVGSIDPPRLQISQTQAAPKIRVTGASLTAITRIEFEWSSANGSGSEAWTHGDANWRSRV